MGFLSKLGSTVIDSFKSNVKNSFDSAKTGIINGFIQGVYEKVNKNYEGVDPLYENLGSVTGITSSYSHKTKGDTSESKINNTSKHKHNGKNSRIKTEGDTYDWKLVNTDLEGDLMIDFPDWTYGDYINERNLFQKQITSLTDEPGYFYFKIFFKFDTQYGLFGGLLNDETYNNGTDESGYATPGFTAASNSAAKYLYISRKLYIQERINDRISALSKFTSILSYINTKAPWFFKSVKGLNNISKPYTSDFMKEKTIEIDTSTESIDMRLSTMMSLYKYACFDEINCKEIIPENLRKFDMQIVLFGMPIRYLHTSFKGESGYHKYKSMAPSNKNFSNVMSYKMYTFKNCEFDMETLGNMIPDNVTNNEPFQMGNSTIKIKYDRVYEHTMNEFNGMMFGTDGFYYNQYTRYQQYLVNAVSSSNEQLKRYSDLINSLENYNNSSGKNANDYKNIIDASEAIIQNNLIKVSPYAMGNIYGEYFLNGGLYYNAKLQALKNKDNLGNLYGSFVKQNSNYNQDKLKALKKGESVSDIIRNQNNYNNGNSDETSTNLYTSVINSIGNSLNEEDYSLDSIRDKFKWNLHTMI